MVPKLKKQNIIDALKFIDENGVPEHNTSVKYVLVSEDGKKYPPKYVVAVADHLANSTDISTESFNSVDAKNYLESLGFSIETNLLIEDIFYHPMNKSGTGAQRLFDGNVGLIYPDFISRSSEPRIIADAKYKPLDNIGNRDYLQVLAYMFRFDAKAGYYLYPEAEGSDDLKLWLNRGSTYEKNVMPRDDISVTKHGLKIPVDALNYDEFSARMKTCEQEFKSALIF